MRQKQNFLMRSLGVKTFFLTSFFLSSRAIAKPFFEDFMHSTDASSENLFLVNPATFLPKAFALGGIESNQKQTIDVEDVRDNVPSKTQNKASRNFHGFGFLVTPGAGLGLGLNFTNEAEEVYSTNDQSFWRQVAQQETRLRREVTGKMTLEFTPNLRIGVLFRYQVLKGSVLGSFNAQPDDRSSYSGSLYGGGVGMSFVAGTGAVGIAYLTPLRGKVKVEGESKVTSDPGLILANSSVEFGKNFHGGIYWKHWTHETNELAQPTTGPNKLRKTSISLLGVDQDSILFPVQAFGIGLDGKFSEKLGLRSTFAREQAEFVTNPDKLPGEIENKSNVFNFYQVRESVFMHTNDFSAELGLDYNSRKATRNPSDNETVKYVSESLGYFASFLFFM